jgi:hypothetical protein
MKTQKQPQQKTYNAKKVVFYYEYHIRNLTKKEKLRN